ncbi:hypothetical protein BVY03_04860 [bacterium K02(2017)]|nr:hypothetical protein BVY03_04860 [bacterium K02(2017)]
MTNKRIIIGITGASGGIYGIKLLESCKKIGLETHLICSENGERTLKIENKLTLSDLKPMADYWYDSKNMAAAISSGSFQTMGMIVAPCSMRSLAEIANGVSTSLVSRAADVVLKERRKLLLMVRETPFNAIHLKNMTQVTNCGGIIMPPIPSFYDQPQDINQMITQSVGRALDLFDLPHHLTKRWQDS